MGTSRRTPATDSARERIKQYIIDHRLTPGSAIPTEMVLCEELGVSRSSVREAIRQLHALDIVEVHHGRGTVVGAISLEPLVDSVTFRCAVDQRDAAQVLREIVQVRKSLDVGQARDIVDTLAGGRHEDLHALAEAMIAKADRGESFASEDRRFHTLLLEQATGNTLAQSLIGAFWDIHTSTIQRVGVPQHADIVDTAAAHRTMLRAAEEGDLTAYLEAIDAHYAPLLRVLDRIPD